MRNFYSRLELALATVLESPISLEPVQGPDEEGSISDRDRRLMRVQKVIDDLARDIPGADYKIRVVPINVLRKDRYLKLGDISSVAAIPGVITIVIDRAGPDPWSPWMIRHRVGHAVVGKLSKTDGDGVWNIGEMYAAGKFYIDRGDRLDRTLVIMFMDILTAYGLGHMVNDAGIDFGAEEWVYNLIHVFAAPFAMRSARRHLLTDLGELKNELVADLLTHGHIRTVSLPREFNLDLAQRSRQDIYNTGSPTPVKSSQRDNDMILRLNGSVNINYYKYELEKIICTVLDSVVGTVLYSS